MLGGYPQISRIDLRGSANFLAKIRRTAESAFMGMGSADDSATRQWQRLPLAVDCGAGIGRVTSGFLSNACQVVDIVEPVAKFAEVIATSALKQEGRVGDIYITGLEAWQPTKRYNLIWNQWCLGHLTDQQLVSYLQRCGRALAEGGWIGVKENLSTHSFGEDIYDEVDSSVTRSDGKFRELFDGAGLHLIKGELQSGFPKTLGLYPVKMYALKPK